MCVRGGAWALVICLTGAQLVHGASGQHALELASQGKFEEALAEAQEVLAAGDVAAQPDAALALVARACALRGEGKGHLAIPELEAALERGFSFEDAYPVAQLRLRLGECYRDTYQPRKSVAQYKAVIRDYPGSAEAGWARVMLIDAYKDCRLFPQALEVAEEVLASEASTAQQKGWAAYLKGEVLLAGGDLEGAVAAFDAFAEGHPDWSEQAARARYKAAEALMQLEDGLPEAVSRLEALRSEALEEDLRYWVIKQLGECYVAQGRLGKAIKTWRSGIEDPSDLDEWEKKLAERIGEGLRAGGLGLELEWYDYLLNPQAVADPTASLPD